MAGPLLSPKANVGASARWGFWRRGGGVSRDRDGALHGALTVALKTERDFPARESHSEQRERPSKGRRCRTGLQGNREGTEGMEAAV